MYMYILHLVCKSSSIIILEVHRINYMEYFCTYVIRGNVHVVKTCVCSEFAMSAVRAYLCSVGRGWVGIVMVSLG
jgi:hypothetical protein